MELHVQNQVLHRQFLSKVAFNTTHNLLAAIPDAADTVSFFHYQSTLNIFTEIFQSSSRPSGKKSSLAWSPNGFYLSLGSSNLELWKLEDHKLSPLRNYNDDFIDIKIIAWSPDSTSLAYAGLSKKNSVKIRSIEGVASGQLSFDLTVSSISYDPFGKYLLILARSNILYVYNCTSLSKLREVPLSPQADPLKNTSTVKEIRTMSWSPDFNYLVCPSIDDSKVSLAFSLCRSLNFKITHAFIGHASSISCASFCPILYQWQGEPCSILALGDSHGVVSLWRVSSKTEAIPLFISNSKTEYNEVVEQLEWSITGDIIFVNVMKRYINIITFNKNCFGREISIEEKSSIIQQNFGVMSAAQIHKKQLEIFSFDSSSAKQTGQNKQKVPIKSDQYNFSQKTTGERLGNTIQYVKINEQITTKDKNNRKRIQPAMLVRREDIQKKKQLNENVLMPKTIVTTILPIQYNPLNLKPLSGEIELGKLFTNRYLDLKKIQNYSILQLLDFKDGEFVVTNERTFTGIVQLVKNIQKLVYVYNKGNLYIFDYELNLQELPICLGQLSRLAINDQGDIYFLTLQGFIRGFNHLKRQCYTPSSVPLHPLLHTQVEDKNKLAKSVEYFAVESDHNLYVSISEMEERYLFDRQTASWITLEFNKGLLKAGHSLKVTDLEEKLIDDFFRKINGKVEAEQPRGSTSLQQYENNLIYYRKHNPNRQLYKQNLLGLIRELRVKGMAEKLRGVLCKYFVDEASSFYEKDESLRVRVRGVGGNVIEEFVHFMKL